MTPIDVDGILAGFSALGGMGLSPIFSFLKGPPFNIKGETALKGIIIFCAGYVILVAALKSIHNPTPIGIVSGIFNGVLSGMAALVGSQGFYKVVQEAEQAAQGK